MSFTSPSEQLLFEQHGRVAIFTFNRPEARNALSDDLTGALRKGLAWAATDDSVGAVVITGAGTAFCAGGDVKAMGNRASAPMSLQAQYDEMISRHLELAGALHKMRKPTIAAMPGAAAGAGMAMALACDFRIASDSAFLSTAYARIGLSGDYGIAWLLTRTVGPAKARELMLTSARVSAQEALKLHLVNQVCPDADLKTETIKFAETLANGPAIAFAYMKDNLDEAFSVDHATAIEHEADRLLKARSTNDHKEAVKAFAEKREPKFTNT